MSKGGHPGDEPQDPRVVRVEARVFVLVALVSAALVAYYTLFPFDFHRTDSTLRDAVSGFDAQVFESYVWLDASLNLLLFAPLGFAVAGLTLARTSTPNAVRTVAVAVGLAFAFVLELLQTLYLTRFASTTDVVVNALGAAAGAEIALRWAPRVVDASAAAVRRGARGLNAPRLVVVVAVWLSIWTVFAATTVSQMRLQDWNPAYPLIVGNETSGDRPWNGTVTSLLLVDAVLDDEHLDGSASVDARDDVRVIASHDFTQGLTGLPELTWRGSGPSDHTSDGVRLSPEAWLQSVGAATDISRALAHTSQFTLVIEAATDSTEQYGPARLVSISGGVLERNLTLGQQGADLAIRIRTPVFGPNGTAPELLVPDVFVDDSVQRIVVRFDGSSVDIDIDHGRVKRSTEFTAEVAAQLRVFPNTIDGMRVGSPSAWMLPGVYRLIVLLPFSLLLAWWIRGGERRLLVPIAGLAGVVVFEFLLIAPIPRYDWRLSRLAMTATVVIASVLVILTAARWLGSRDSTTPLS